VHCKSLGKKRDTNAFGDKNKVQYQMPWYNRRKSSIALSDYGLEGYVIKMGEKDHTSRVSDHLIDRIAFKEICRKAADQPHGEDIEVK
jgi:hypothetical protein